MRAYLLFFLKIHIPFAIIAFLSVQTHAQSALLRSGLTTASTYRISHQSTLTLEVLTNVNGYTCHYTETFTPQRFYFERMDDENCSITFNETHLNLKVRSLDCGNKIMNKDMYGALNADAFPNIRIELLQTIEEHCDDPTPGNGLTEIMAFVRITLNGRSNDYVIRVHALSTGPGQFRFTGSKVLHMTDFGIDPPTAALGIIKVRDEIRIGMDMWVTME